MKLEDMQLEYLNETDDASKLKYYILVIYAMNLCKKYEYTMDEVLNEYFRRNKLLECLYILHYHYSSIQDYQRARDITKDIFNHLLDIPLLKWKSMSTSNDLYITLAIVIFYYWLKDIKQAEQQYPNSLGKLIQQVYDLRIYNAHDTKVALEYIIHFINKHKLNISNDLIILLYKNYVSFAPGCISLKEIIPIFIEKQLDASILYNWLVEYIYRSTRNMYEDNKYYTDQLYRYDTQAKLRIDSLLSLRQLKTDKEIFYDF